MKANRIIGSMVARLSTFLTRLGIISNTPAKTVLYVPDEIMDVIRKRAKLLEMSEVEVFREQFTLFETLWCILDKNPDLTVAMVDRNNKVTHRIHLPASVGKDSSKK